MNYLKNHSFETRASFNPPYSGLLIIYFIQFYTQKTKEKFSPGLIFLILPLCMNDIYTDIFLSNSKKSLFQIVQLHKDEFNVFAINYENYIEITIQALFFLTEIKVLDIQENSIVLNTKLINLSQAKIEYKFEIQKVKTISSILAKINDLSSIFITLGVKL